MRKRLHALWQHIRSDHTSPPRIAAAVFLGVFIGVLPIYGIQTPICLVVAHVLKLNKLTIVLAANISNPLFAPFLVAGGIVIGEYVRFGQLRSIDVEEARTFLAQLSVFAGEVPGLYVSCFIGDTILGLVLGAGLAVAAWRVALRRSSDSAG